MSNLDENGFVALDATDEDRARAIVDCHLCDDEGYFGARICDHVDRTETAKRGSALVRAELAKIRERKSGTAKRAEHPQTTTEA